jgi:hypothetical protein
MLTSKKLKPWLIEVWKFGSLEVWKFGNCTNIIEINLMVKI